jgi:hypothetical protein
VLIDIAGHISDADLAAGNEEYENFPIDKMINHLLIIKKQILASIKKSKGGSKKHSNTY